MKNINWKVRVKNPMFWIQVIVSIFVPILAYMGITTSDLTTWGKLFEVIGTAVSNPYVLVTVVVSIYNTIIDPTTKGASDSEQALTYTEPK